MWLVVAASAAFSFSRMSAAFNIIRARSAKARVRNLKNVSEASWIFLSISESDNASKVSRTCPFAGLILAIAILDFLRRWVLRRRANHRTTLPKTRTKIPRGETCCKYVYRAEPPRRRKLRHLITRTLTVGFGFGGESSRQTRPPRTDAPSERNRFDLLDECAKRRAEFPELSWPCRYAGTLECPPAT